MKRNDREREYASNEGGMRMRIVPYGFGVRAAVCENDFWPTAWYKADDYEQAVRFVTEYYGTAWRRVELTHIGW